MPLNIIVGAQWGDEGKGRMVDLMAAKAKIVARFSGGDNAGHTVTVGDQIYKLHLLPSGLIQEHTVGIMGNGMVINPKTLITEIKMLADAGIDVGPERLKISTAAHLITPAHIALDAAQESLRGKGMIGTTLRGIGPAYMDKSARRGLRVGEMLNEEEFTDAVKAHIEFSNQRLTKLYGAEALDPQLIAAEYLDYARILKPYITDTVRLIGEALKEGEAVLAEGAQGTLLDLDLGTYPFVTSSHPTSSGALVGLGVGPKDVGEVVGVTKVFQTRVGEGVMPTELEGEVAGMLRGTGSNPWDEFGTTTGRPRRVGWLDMVLLRYAAQVNGFTKLALTKLDILSGIDPLKICVGYKHGDKIFKHFPIGMNDLEEFEPILEEMPGWQADVQGCRKWEDLPPEAQAYVRKIEEAGGVKVGWISVGPERDQIAIL